MYQFINCLNLVILRARLRIIVIFFFGWKNVKKFTIRYWFPNHVNKTYLSLRNFSGNSVKMDRLWSLCTAIFKDSQCLTVPHRLHFKERPSSFEGALLLFRDFAQLLMLLLWLGSKSHNFNSLYNFPLKFLEHLLFWSLHPSIEELESVKHSEIN